MLHPWFDFWLKYVGWLFRGNEIFVPGNKRSCQNNQSLRLGFIIISRTPTFHPSHPLHTSSFVYEKLIFINHYHSDFSILILNCLMVFLRLEKYKINAREKHKKNIEIPHQLTFKMLYIFQKHFKTWNEILRKKSECSMAPSLFSHFYDLFQPLFHQWILIKLSKTVSAMIYLTLLTKNYE